MPDFLTDLHIRANDLGKMDSNQQEEFNARDYCLVDVPSSEMPHAHGGNTWLKPPHVVVDHHHGDSNGIIQIILREQTCSTLIALAAFGQMWREFSEQGNNKRLLAHDADLLKLVPLMIAGIATDTSLPLLNLDLYKHETLFEPIAERKKRLADVWRFGNLAHDRESLKSFLDWLSQDENLRLKPGFLAPEMARSIAKQWARPEAALEALFYLLPCLDAAGTILLENQVSIQGHELYPTLEKRLEEYSLIRLGDLVVATVKLESLDHHHNSHLTGGMADILLQRIIDREPDYVAHLVITLAKCWIGAPANRNFGEPYLFSIRANQEFLTLAPFTITDLITELTAQKGGIGGGDGLRGGGTVLQFLTVDDLYNTLRRLEDRVRGGG